MAMNIILNLTKVDAAQRLVYGTFTEEQGDRSGEIMDYTSSKPNFEKWSNDQYGASNGKSYGNLRAMHKNIAAGLFVEPLTFDDDLKKITGVARVVDDDEWRKVEEGVYTGFSVGGRYGKRWSDPKASGLTRYEALPSEVSLVDLPCVKGATFDYIKAENEGPLQKNFLSVVDTEEEVKAALEKFVHPEADPDPKVAPEDAAQLTKIDQQAKPSESESNFTVSETPAQPSVSPSADLEQVWKAKDGTTFSKKADAIKHNNDLATKELVEGAAKPARDAFDKLSALLTGDDSPVEQPSDSTPTGDPNSEKPPIKEPEISKTVFGYKARKTRLQSDITKGLVKGSKEKIQENFSKGMWDIGRVAGIVCDMDWLADCLLSESIREGDKSPLPANAQQIVNDLVMFLRRLVIEETEELLTDTDDDGVSDDVIIIMAAAGLRDDMRKAIQGIEGVNAKLVEVLEKASAKELSEKAHQQEVLEKGFLALTESDLTLDNTSLPPAVKVLLAKNAGLSEEFVKLTGNMGALTAKVEVLLAQPMPPKGALRAISKTVDSRLANGTVPDALDTPEKVKDAYQKWLDGLPPEQRSMQLMKLALASPVMQIE